MSKEVKITFAGIELKDLDEEQAGYFNKAIIKGIHKKDKLIMDAIKHRSKTITIKGVD